MKYICVSGALMVLVFTSIVLVRRSSAEPEALKSRIKELNEKFTQMLLFLSVAIVGAATLNSDDLDISPDRVRSAIMWFVIAIFPVLIVVLPVKELAGSLKWDGSKWYGWVL